MADEAVALDKSEAAVGWRGRWCALWTLDEAGCCVTVPLVVVVAVAVAVVG